MTRDEFLEQDRSGDYKGNYLFVMQRIATDYTKESVKKLFKVLDKLYTDANQDRQFWSVYEYDKHTPAVYKELQQFNETLYKGWARDMTIKELCILAKYVMDFYEADNFRVPF